MESEFDKYPRRERRKRLKYYEEELEKHLKKTPKINTSFDVSEEEIKIQQNAVKMWAVRKNTLERRIGELKNGNS